MNAWRLLYYVFILLAIVSVFIVRPLYFGLAIAVILIITGYAALSHGRLKEEGVVVDERESLIELKASSSAFNTLIVALGLFVASALVMDEIGVVDVEGPAAYTVRVSSIYVGLGLALKFLYTLYYKSRLGG
ncbi:MAG: DUF2178 domain-containing protein [Desulfurococcales archaeon]|nr:DUF2178 domain-containing protein [Desulfurococcales archaeon]